MLPKQNRISSKRYIKRLFKKGKRSRGQLISIIFDPNHLAQNRFVFVISKSNIKKATQRNRIKRKIANLILRKKKFKVASGLGQDIIIIANHALPQKQEEQYLKEFEIMLAKIERK